MNFDFSEEQTMLRDSVARFVQDDYDFDTRRAIVASEEGMSRENWQTFAELGWLSVPFARGARRLRRRPVDVMVMMEEFGKGLVVEPYFATVVLFGGLLRAAGSEAQQAQYIPASSMAASRRLCLPRAPEPLRAGRHRHPGHGATATALCSTARRWWSATAPMPTR
jgi:alkylation response protein AidB-like acyl-CoA dehydrogenase